MSGSSVQRIAVQPTRALPKNRDLELRRKSQQTLTLAAARGERGGVLRLAQQRAAATEAATPKLRGKEKRRAERATRLSTAGAAISSPAPRRLSAPAPFTGRLDKETHRQARGQAGGGGGAAAAAGGGGSAGRMALPTAHRVTGPMAATGTLAQAAAAASGGRRSSQRRGSAIAAEQHESLEQAQHTSKQLGLPFSHKSADERWRRASTIAMAVTAAARRTSAIAAAITADVGGALAAQRELDEGRIVRARRPQLEELWQQEARTCQLARAKALVTGGKRALAKGSGSGYAAAGRAAGYGGLGAAPTLVTPHVLLGDREHARSLELLQALGVTHVLNVSLEVPNFHLRCGHLLYNRLPVRDNDPAFRLAGEQLLPQALAFVRRCAELGGRCLVHGKTGDGAAAAVVAALLHAPPPTPPPKPRPPELWPPRRGPHTLAAALLLLLQLRPSARPSEGSMLDLAQAEIDSRRGASSLCVYGRGGKKAPPPAAAVRVAGGVAVVPGRTSDDRGAAAAAAARSEARRAAMTERQRAEDALCSLLDFDDMEEELEDAEDAGRSRFALSLRLSRKVRKKKGVGTQAEQGQEQGQGGPGRGGGGGIFGVLRRLFSRNRKTGQ